MNTTTTTTALFADFVARLNGVTVSQRDTADKVIKAAGGLDAALSSYLKTGKATAARVGALAYVYRGILECFEHGQKSRLLGFATGTKKSTDAFAFVRDAGIVSDAGAVLIGVDPAAKGKAIEALQSRAADFIALYLTFSAAAAAAREAEREAAKTKKDSEASSEASSSEASSSEASSSEASSSEVLAPAPELSEGQQDEAAVSRIVARWALLSEDNKASLLALLAPAKPAAAKPAAAKPAAAKPAV